MRICFYLLFCFCTLAQAYELVIVQGVSKTGFTFVTRNGKKDGVFKGKNATFTSDNISLIAKAISVTRQFTQWEVQNDETTVPFRKGEVVTMYDATEHLWALTPETIRKKYIKTEIFTPRLSIGAHVSFFTGISASVSDAADTPDQRGGLVFEGMLEKEINESFALAGGFRYSRETINVAEASLTASQALGLAEIRYYFNKMPSFHNARLALALGMGYGQSQTQTSGQTSSGNAVVLPITKASLNVPMNKLTDFVVEGSFESVRTDEEFEDGTTQSSNVDNFRYGVALKRYFE
ncbi:MAG: hypothetical protein KC478_06150 [Bacteriovoracaceae bacterium]|nr:hypothetical protein [Bacteriovoracaceae bacterium]